MEKLIAIDGVIVERRDPMMEWWMGLPEGSTYASHDFVDSVKELKKGDSLRIELFTDGGNVDAGKRIYNECKELQKRGVEVTTFNKGKQHSIGNVIMLGGSKRLGYPSSTGLVHSVRISPEYFFQFGGGVTADDAEVVFSDLALEDDLMLDIYALETGTSKDALRGLLKAGKTLGAQQLLALGFLTEIVTDGEAVPERELSNIVYSNKFKFNLKNQKMSKSNWQTEFANLKKDIGQLFKKHNIAEVTNQDFATQEGGTLSVEREEGDIQEGDAATVNGEPDGVCTLEDGRTVTVTAGVITSITEASAGNDDTEDLENLRAENAALQAENDTLKQDLAALNVKFKKVNAIVDEFASLHAIDKAPARQVGPAKAGGAKSNDASSEATIETRKKLRGK